MVSSLWHAPSGGAEIAESEGEGGSGMPKDLKMGERASESMDRWLDGLSALDLQHANLGAFFGSFVG